MLTLKSRQAVYAYSGTQIFLDFMSEMSQPRDFLKAMWSSQFFIYACYMMYGLFIYYYQGQYVQNPSYLGMSPYTWSTVGNSLAMVTAFIAAALYGNLGLKGKVILAYLCFDSPSLTLRQSFITVLVYKYSMPRHFILRQESGSGRELYRFIGPSHM